jgi:hypothetical protein
MNAIVEHSRGLRLLARLNGDLVLYILTILFALSAGAWVGMLGVN